MLSASTVKIHDSNKNLKATITGIIDPEDETSLVVLDLRKLAGAPVGIRLDSIVWLIEEKAGLRLYWGDTLIIPMESRNFLRLDHPLDSPRSQWSGEVILRCPKTEASPKAFFVHLEFDKQ